MAGRKIVSGLRGSNGTVQTTNTDYHAVLSSQSPHYYFDFDEASGEGGFNTNAAVCSGSSSFGGNDVVERPGTTPFFDDFRQPENELCLSNPSRPGSVFFDGTQFLENADSEDDMFNSSFQQSTTFIFAPSTTSPRQTGLVCGGGSAHGHLTYWFNSRVIFCKAMDSERFWCVSPPLSPGKKYHVATTFDESARTMKLYIDGEEVRRMRTAGQTTFGSANFRIGGANAAPVFRNASQSLDTTSIFSGSITKVATFDRVLTDSEIQAQYEASTGTTLPTRFDPKDYADLKVWHDVQQGDVLFQPEGKSELAGRTWDNYSFGANSVAVSGGNATWSYQEPELVFANSEFTNTESFTQPFTFFLVAEWRAVEGFRFILDGDSSSTGTSDRVAFGTDSGPNLYLFAGNPGNVLGPTPEENRLYLYSLVVDGANSEVYVDGNLVASGDAGSNTLNGFTLGKNVGNSQNWAGNFREVLMYDQGLTDTERETVEGYLGQKYLLKDDFPLTHPYKGTRP